MSLLYLVKESARAIRRGGDGQSRTHCAPSPTRCDALCIRRTATAAPGTHTHNLPLIGAAITICDCPGQDAPQRRTKRAFQQRVDQLEEEACARACRANLCPCAATIALCTEPHQPPPPPPHMMRAVGRCEGQARCGTRSDCRVGSSRSARDARGARASGIRRAGTTHAPTSHRTRATRATDAARISRAARAGRAHTSAHIDGNGSVASTRGGSCRRRRQWHVVSPRQGAATRGATDPCEVCALW